MEMMWMTSPQVGEEARRGTPVVVPFGSVEQHGPHLPLSTDTMQAYGVAVLAAERTRALVAPPVHYGQCSSTRNHPGTVTLSPPTLRALAADILRSLARQGFTRIVLLSGHAGRIHMAGLREAAETVLAERTDMVLAVVCDLDLVRENSADLIRTPYDGHAGEVETSRMLYLHPERVRGTASAGHPRFPKHRIVPNPEEFWRNGVWGDPGEADAEKGRLLVERSAEALARILAEMA